MLTPEWISVKDRLPEMEGVYLTYGKFSGRTGYRCSHFSCVKFWGQVTHWQPLPDPPKAA
jgi:hypothetical protein